VARTGQGRRPDGIRRRMRRVAQRAGVRYAAHRGDLLAQVLIRPPHRDPYPVYDRIRSRGPVTGSTLGPVGLSADHGFVSQALRSSRLETFDTPALANGLIRPLEDSFLMRNRPDHPRLRRLVSPWFTVRALAERREAIRAVAEARLDELARRDTFDLVQDYAVPVTVRVICELTGLPGQDWQRLAALGGILPISTASGTLSTRQRRQLFDFWADVNDYLDTAVAAGTAPAGTPAAALIEQAADPDRLDRRDLLSTLGVLLVAGFETSVGLIGSLGLHLVDEPHLRERCMLEPQTLPAALEETLRLEPPVQFTARRVVEDGEVAGVPLAAGSELVLLIGGACRDPRVFTEPDRFRLDRPNARAHLAFSAGEHYCIGANLARLETEVSLRALFERYPQIRRAAAPRWLRAQNIRARRTVPVAVGGPGRRPGTVLTGRSRPVDLRASPADQPVVPR